jgi:hypothetical protein
MNDNKKTKTKTTKAITSVARYAKERYWEDSSTGKNTRLSYSEDYYFQYKIKELGFRTGRL